MPDSAHRNPPDSTNSQGIIRQSPTQEKICAYDSACNAEVKNKSPVAEKPQGFFLFKMTFPMPF
jgi:hypothetical protein